MKAEQYEAMNVTFEPHDFEWADHAVEVDSQEIFVRQSTGRQFITQFSRNRGAVIGLVMLTLIIFMAIFGPYMNHWGSNEQVLGNQAMAPRIPFLEDFGFFDGKQVLSTSTNQIVLDKYHDAPGKEDIYYWFGSDVLGRDIFTRTWEGARISLYIAFVAVIVDIFIGMIYGLTSGYFGGKVDLIMQRILEIINGIPSLVIVTLLIVIMKPGIISITIAIALTGWIGMSRIARAQILKLKEREFVLASRTLGASPWRLIFKEILPNIFAQLIVMSMFSIPNAIFTEAYLAFIGLGVPMPDASLGSLISDSFKSFLTAPFMILPPVITLSILMLSFNLVADGLRDALDPTMKEV